MFGTLFFAIKYSIAVSVQSKGNNSYCKVCFTLLYCFRYFNVLFIYLTTFVAWSCCRMNLHTANKYHTTRAHGTAKYLHTIFFSDAA